LFNLKRNGVKKNEDQINIGQNFWSKIIGSKNVLVNRIFYTNSDKKKLLAKMVVKKNW